MFASSKPDRLAMSLSVVCWLIYHFDDIQDIPHIVYLTMLALNSYKPNLYDLVILDVIMSEMNGFELYSRLIKMDPGIKVCFLTASSETYREEFRKEKYNELSRDLFLEMPLPTKEIIDEIKKRIE
jgi:CheY-like chemotaxis protein